MDWPKILRFLKEESPYLCIAIAIIMAFLFVLPLFVGHDVPVIEDVIKMRGQFLPYVFFSFIFFSVFGVYGLITRAAKRRNDRVEEARNRAQKELLLSELKKAEKQGQSFPSQASCVEWSAKVQPLLRFSGTYHSKFEHFASIVPLGLSSVTTKPTLESMRAIVKQAIEELKADLER